MPLNVRKVGGDLYVVHATPPQVQYEWFSASMTSREAIHELLNRGSHQNDVGDAFYAAHPHWLTQIERPDGHGEAK